MLTRTLSPVSAPSSPSAPGQRTSTRSAVGAPEERRPKKGDEDYVKRPEDAFILFRRRCCEERALSLSSSAPSSMASGPSSVDSPSQAANATGKKQRQADLSKTISQQWKALSPEERAKWEALAKEKKREHEALHPNYVYRPQRAAWRNFRGISSSSANLPATFTVTSANRTPIGEHHRVATPERERGKNHPSEGTANLNNRPNCTGPRIPDPPDAPRAAREVLTEALRALKNAPGAAILRSIICPVLDSIEKIQARAHTSPKRAQDPYPDLPDAPRATREVLTEALRALKYAPGVAVLRSIIRPLLDIIDKMQGLGCLHDAGFSRDKSGDTSSEDRLEASDSIMTGHPIAGGRIGNIGALAGKGDGSQVELTLHGTGNIIFISGGTGGNGGAGNLGGQGGTGHGPVITVARPGGGFCFN